MLPGMAGKLYTAETVPGLRGLGLRVLFVLALIAGVSLVVYFEGGLNDARSGGHPGYLDCLYFSIVTITTVGYGDIVPVATVSRLTDAFVLTPVRFVIFFVIFGTAYQLAIRRFTEEYRMKRIQETLENHVLVCGYGATGAAAAEELLLQGTPPDRIVVIDRESAALEEAAQRKVICIQGDATREHVLSSAAVGKAAYALVCTGRDDTTTLIVLTLRALNPETRITAACRESENVKLLQRSGAHHIISAAMAGGNIMAAATRHPHLVETLEDILTVRGGLRIDERAVRPEEAGKAARELPGIAVLRVYRGETCYGVDQLPALAEGDILVYIAAGTVYPVSS
jgi:voltage-gated potassium channel